LRPGHKAIKTANAYAQQSRDFAATCTGRRVHIWLACQHYATTWCQYLPLLAKHHALFPTRDGVLGDTTWTRGQILTALASTHPPFAPV